ncbi:MAG: class I adenylate-forming enzyme family protein [Candidatus Hodarchaeota archaeon]
MPKIKPEVKHGIRQVTWRMYEKDYSERHLIHHVIEYWAKKTPSEIAIISGDTGRDYSWRQVKEAMDGMALKLIEMGVQKGDYIASSLPFFPEHIFFMYGAFKIGAIFVPLDLRLKPPEAERCIQLVNAKIYAHLGKTDFADFGIMSEAVMKNCESLKYCIQFAHPDEINESTDITEVISALEFATDAQELLRKVNSGEEKELGKKLQEMSEAIEERDGCLVIYTTGSTSGYPKPALLSHQGITSQNLALGMGYNFDEPSEIMLVNLPPSHVGGLTQQFMTTLFFGAKAVVLDIFKPDLSLEAIQKYKVTILGQIPALFNMEWRIPNYNNYDLSSLKFALYGGQTVSRPFLERMSKMAPKFGTGLGMTELSGMGTYTPLDGTVDDILAGVGYPMPITPLSIREPMNPDGTAGKEKPEGEPGEICFSGPQVFLGYANDEENTKKTISSDGWLYSGDLGFFDDKGLHFAGRAKWMIKPKGYNVFPAEVENFIAKKFKDRVEVVGVIGMPHEVFVEGIVAFVEKKPGKHLTVEEVNKACKEMAAYKRPSHVVIMEPAQLPLNRVEKTDYVLLRNIAEKEIEELREKGGWDKA